MRLKNISESITEKIPTEALAQKISEYSGNDFLLRTSDYPGVGIDPSKMTGNNWVNGLFFTTLFEKVSPQKAKNFLGNNKYIIIAKISPDAKVYDRSKVNTDQFNTSVSEIFSLSRQLADRYPKKEALRQAFLEKGIEVIIGGHDRYEVTAFVDDAIEIIAIYEIEE